MGLSMGEGLSVRAGGLYVGQKKMESETADTERQNENLYLKKGRNCIVLFIYLLGKENLYLKSYLSGSKIEINTFIWVGLCVGELI